MKKLINMTAFVLEQAEQHGIDSHETALNSYNYALFLQKPLTRGMVVPCDLDGNVMRKPSEMGFLGSQEMQWDCYRQNYEKAKKRVLFEGFELISSEDDWFKASVLVDGVKIIYSFSLIGTIEDFVNYNLTLTQNAINQFIKL